MIESYVVIAKKGSGEKTHKHYLKLSMAVTATRYMFKSKLYSKLLLFRAFYKSERKVRMSIPDKTERLWDSDKNSIEELNEISKKS
ncbi:hypothetical protein [Anaerovibrio sp. RM50]|uniref:hypothetical protein n=1 Tax=Anaerovibrio sp. RM50 TaxID=1200557 RepID=UPI000480DED7|nr:hypothetical protein [Anaerovibrio sp. RM50]